MTSRASCAALAAALALGGADALPASASASASGSGSGSTRLHIDLDNGETLRPGTVVVDDSGTGASGVVEVRYGGGIRPVPGVQGTRAARFPAPCSTEPCPNAMIAVPDLPELDPGPAPFEWGATVKLTAAQTSPGANVLQKGLHDAVGGQWKLQVDGAAGRPSCVLSGTLADGSTARTVVLSTVSIANGRWRRVTCRRTPTDLQVLVDGVVTRSASAPLVSVSSDAPVTIGAKSVAPQDNDQFWGALDEIYLRLL